MRLRFLGWFVLRNTFVTVLLGDMFVKKFPAYAGKGDAHGQTKFVLRLHICFAYIRITWL